MADKLKLYPDTASDEDGNIWDLVSDVKDDYEYCGICGAWIQGVGYKARGTAEWEYVCCECVEVG